MTFQKILKAQKIFGKNLIFRNVLESDAQFILSLRTDESRSRYLSKTSNDVLMQIQWLKKYEEKISGEAYFIIQTKDDVPIGTVRIYDELLESFSWGSWILSRHAPSTAGIESALMIYEYGINKLGFQSAHFEVLKDNISVWEFHQRFGAIKTHEDTTRFFFKIEKGKIQKALMRYRKYLPNGITVYE